MAGTPADEHFEREVWRHYRYNFTVHVIEGGLVWFGFGCAAISTILPTYLSLLTRSKLLIVLPQHLFYASWSMTMLFVAYIVQRYRTRKGPCVAYGVAVRLMMVVWGVTALATKRYGAVVGLVGVYAGLLSLMVSAGPSELCWCDLTSRIIPRERRGRFFGARQLVGVAAGVAAAWLVYALIGPADQARPEQFGVPFLIGAAAFAASLPLVAITREPVHPDPPPRAQGYWAYLLHAVDVLRRNVPFRRYVLIRTATGLTGLFAAGLFAPYAREQFGISARTISGPFTTVMVISQIASGPALGWLADRRGYRLVFAFAVACGACASLVGLTLPLWPSPAMGFAICYAFAGMGGTAMFMATFNMTFEFAGVHSRSLYIAIASTLPAPVFVAAGAAGGLLVDHVGFVPALAASAVIHLAVAALVVWLLPEPRHLPHVEPPFTRPIRA